MGALKLPTEWSGCTTAGGGCGAPAARWSWLLLPI
eukprot:SAG31_NODE_18096_length_647_cov_0.854015_1_plen_34_part_01